MKAKVFLGLVLLAASVPSIFSQIPSDTIMSNDAAPSQTEILELPYALKSGMNEFGVWGGGSFDSPAGSFLGTTPDRKFIIGALRYGRILAANKSIALEYTIDVIPLAVVTNNPRVVNTAFSLPDGRTTILRTEVGRKSIYGAGISPIGFQVHFGNKKRIKPFASGSAGFLYFSQQVPEPDTHNFNYSFDFGGGVRFFNRSGRAFTMGYKYHHLSNANQGRFNPGLDANIFYAGFSIIR